MAEAAEVVWKWVSGIWESVAVQEDYGGCRQRGQRKKTERGRKVERQKRRRRGRSKRGKMLLLRLLTVSLEDLRLLMLEARLVLMDLKEAFFLGSGSALPLFLS